MLLFIIKVIQPSLTAMFGRFEEVEVGAKKEIFGNFVPSASSLMLDRLSQELILLLAPKNLAGLDHVEILKLQKLL